MSEGSSPCQEAVHLGRRDLKVCSSDAPTPTWGGGSELATFLIRATVLEIGMSGGSSPCLRAVHHVRGSSPRSEGSESMFIGFADPDLVGVKTHNFFDPSNRSGDRHVWGQFTMSEGSSPCQGAVHLGRRDLKVCSSDPPTPI